MASLLTVRLNKDSAPTWGFRLQGGKDFGTPLIIQKVTSGTPAERAGLSPGDSVIKINNIDVFNLRHKDAQDVVVRAGNNFDMTIQRGGSTWKPQVIPTGSYPAPSPNINNLSTVTQTSLHARPSENIGAIGTGHNVSAKPFSPQVNGSVNGGPRVVNKQYNTPLKLYSEESIAETLSAQTEVLSTGALGVNFKKNEKDYDASNSAVFRMLKEAESEPRTPDQEPDSGVITAPNSGIAGLRHVSAPENRPKPATPQLPPGQNICADCERLIVHAIGGRTAVRSPRQSISNSPNINRSNTTENQSNINNSDQPGPTICTDCERVIVGVFVRIKDKNLHVECFKCATCGSSLKNVGYYNINNKLYCDIHAKSAAINNPPAANLVPITVPPGGKVPANAISAALASHSLPSPSPLSPKGNSFASPYKLQENEVASPSQNFNITNEASTNNNPNINNNLYNNSTPLSYSKYLTKSSSNFSGPKPFSSVSAPISPHNTLPRAAPLSPRSPISSGPAPNFSPVSSAGHSVQNVIWPPPQEDPDSLPTACPLYFPPPSQVEAQLLAKKAESLAESDYCYSEYEEMASFHQPKMSICSEEVCSFSERKSATECIETISESLETQKLVENIMKTRPRSPPPLDVNLSLREESAKSITCCQRKDSCELRRPTQFTPNTLECQLQSSIQNPVPQGWESPMVQALRTVPDPFSQIPSKQSSTPLASALKIAPAEPFTPVPVNIMKPIPLPEETVPYFPPEHPITVEPKEVKPKAEKKADSPFVKALVIAPDRPYTPVGGVAPVKKKVVDPIDQFIKELPKPIEKLTMTTALTTAPERPYTPLIQEATNIETVRTEKSKYTADKSLLTRPIMPTKLPESFKPPPSEPKVVIKEMPPIMIQETEEHQSKKEKDTKQVKIIEKRELKPAVPATISKNRLEGEEVQVTGNFPPIFQGFSCSFQNKTEHSQFSVEVITTPPVLTPTPTEKSHSASSLAISEGKSGYMQTTTTREETTSKSESSQKHTKQSTLTSSFKPTEIKNVVRQDEEIVLKKPLPLASALRPAGGLPQYQVNLSAEAEAEIKRMERIQQSQLRMEEQKIMQQKELKVAPQKPIRQVNPPDTVKKPVITLQPDDNRPIQPQMTFQPVSDKPPSTTFSPKPRSLTPSMINKPPAILPYYQANLVAHHCPPAAINLLDPTSPAISRSPSPCPDRRERSPSPFPGAASGATRPKSPAAGPPPNPLRSTQPLPTPKDSRVQVAKQNLTTFIPQYKEKRDLIEQVQGMDFYRRQDEQYVESTIQPQMYSSHVQAHSVAIPQTQQFETSFVSHGESQNILSQQKQMQTQNVKMQESQRIQSLQSSAQPQMYTSHVQAHSVSVPQTQQFETSFVSCEESHDKLSHQNQMQMQNVKMQDSQRMQSHTSHTAQGAISTTVSERAHQAHLEEMKQSQKESVQKFRDGRTEVQRKKTVTEEYEHVQKAQMIEIEKNVSTTKKYPFRDVNPPMLEQPGVMGMHVTNPQPIASPFFKKETSENVQQCCQKKQCASSQNIESSSSCKKEPQQVNPPPPPSFKHVYSPSSQAPVKHVKAPGSKPNQNVIKSNVPSSNLGSGGGRQTGAIGVAPRRGRGVLNAAAIGGARIPLCGQCHKQVRGPFITALGKIWCPDHFICATPSCRRPLQDIGFVEERGQLYCEYCFEQYLAPPCSKCNGKIKGDCLKAIGKNFHPECFNCVYCGKLFANSPFFLEDGNPYCEADWNELFTTKCFACGFPVEAGDRWVEALNNNYHSQCFNCTMCKKNLEGQSFFAKGGRPFCKNHAR